MVCTEYIFWRVLLHPSILCCLRCQPRPYKRRQQQSVLQAGWCNPEARTDGCCCNEDFLATYVSRCAIIATSHRLCGPLAVYVYVCSCVTCVVGVLARSPGDTAVEVWESRVQQYIVVVYTIQNINCCVFAPLALPLPLCWTLLYSMRSSSISSALGKNSSSLVREGTDEQ